MSVLQMGKFFIMYPCPTYKKIQILSTDFNFLYLSPFAHSVGFAPILHRTVLNIPGASPWT